jgi:hypothetical protein|tara:strand:+ start:53 stop:574 length:522 start_codon:yes stop_codon:yes gene_type:complete
MYKINDNYLRKESFEQISNHMMSPHMPWYFQEHCGNTDNEPFFSHAFYDGMKVLSPLYEQIIHEILEQLDAVTVYNVRGNLYCRTGKKEKCAKHIDAEYDKTIGKTSILYINTNNGGTKLHIKGKKPVFIESIANRLVTFDSNIEHQACWQTDTKTRVLINFNYIMDKQCSNM